MKSESPEFAGWRSRGYIPHFDRPDLVQSITVRLEDAVPQKLIDQWKLQLKVTKDLPMSDPRQAALRKRIDKYEDAGHGACWLRNEKVAAMVERSLLCFDGVRYRLIAWCIMPNHVHAIIEIMEGHSLDKILHSWKSYSSHEANRILHRSGKFWFREYHDRYIRNSEHLAQAVEYVERNPVKAGLVNEKQQWRWSSAARR
jgi:putative transposase